MYKRQVFARPDEEVLREAISWADLVHFLLPFRLSMKGLEIARELDVPHTAAFHVQPENITYTLHLGKQQAVNAWLYRFFWDRFYKYFRHIHCPSSFIAGELKANHYTSKLHVVSLSLIHILNDIPGDWGTAVNVQSMVFGNMGNTSGTGVAFTRNPSTGARGIYGEYLINAQGEDVVAGIRTPQPVSYTHLMKRRLIL